MNPQTRSQTKYLQLDFEQAKAKHLLFKSRLRSILYGAEIDEIPVISHYECAVGKWIYNHALKVYGHIPEMLELEKIHADIHTSASELVKKYKEGKVEEARKGLVNIEKIADHLIGLLALVENKVQEEPPTNKNEYSGLEIEHKELTDLLVANEQLDKTIREQSAELIKERQTLHDFFMQAPAIFVILRGPEHIFELVNPLYYDLVGNRQLIGKTVREALPEIVGQGFYELLDKVYNTGETFIGLEVPLSINKGKGVEQLYIDFSYQAFKNAYDESEGILVFANDVTHQVAARKKIEESEQRFRFLANAMPQKVWTANEKGEANYFNQHWIDYTGLTIEDLKGWGWKTIIHPDDWKENQERWQYSIDTGNNFELEHRFLRKDGQYCWHLSRGLPQKNENGMIVMWVGTNTDINDKKIAEQELENKVQERTKELKEANKHLERSNAELEQFAYVTSHDLQEPLRKIQFFNTVLIMRHNENLNEDAKKYIDKVTASAKRMSGLIKDLLEYSRLSKSEMQFEEVDLNKILKNVLTDFELLIAQKKAVIKTDPLPVIDGVSLQMNQLFYNLISNALKFCKKGASSEIIISVTKLSQKQKLKFSELDMQKEYYEIIFRDNGIGFNQEYGQKIFTIFEKLNDRSMFGGYGIGLAICHKIVSNHFGLIKAEGKEMEGATFTIIFPIKQR